MSQIFPFLQIPESLNSAILCKFYLLKFYLLPKIVIRDEPGIKISKNGKPCFTATAISLSTGDTGWCLEEVKNRVHLGMHGGPLGLPQECYLLNFCKL